ncbi:MAG: AbrB/MazE/SpoVT family DNA-binding domain-containing protein [Cyanobacteria bacterium P01_G01_bin.67]
MKLKLRKIGNSIGTTFPKEILDKLQVSEGDTIYLTETPDGIELTAYNPEFEEVMEAASEVTRRYRNALKELAK